MQIRSFEGDHDWLLVMSHLAPLLKEQYPGGDLWLSTRLDDAQRGDARAHLAVSADRLLAIAIESPKPQRQVKLSTLWVAPAARRQGLGRELVSRCTSRWLQSGSPRAWITVNSRARDQINTLVIPRGFRETSCQRDRYGPGRHEWVLHWTPDQHRAALASPDNDGCTQAGRQIHDAATTNRAPAVPEPKTLALR